jgi:hypothetical protein
MDKIELTREEVTKIVRDAYLSGRTNLTTVDEYTLDIVHNIFKFKQAPQL